MSLDDLRRKIDLIDYEIVKLLNERMEHVLRLKRLKGRIADPEREEQVVRNVRRFSGSRINPDFVERLYRAIMEESRSIQERDAMVIGFQGEHGAYSELAAITYDRTLIPIPCQEFADVFDGITARQLDFGIVPVENSLEGSITQVADLLMGVDLNIIGEVNVPIHHFLLTLPETEPEDVRTVLSHPQAIEQCRGFIEKQMLVAEPFYDTAGAARMLSEKRPPATAVIASSLCTELYNLKVVAGDIEDHPSNTTRFVALSREAGKEPGDKCSLMFSAAHEAGSLSDMLRIFSDAEVNLTRIESRPVRADPNRYAFLVDFEGSDREERVRAAIDKVRSRAVTFKFFGCYRSFQEGMR